MEAFEEDGVFWLPGKETVTAAGHLKFDPVEGATLSLTGTLEDALPHFMRTHAPSVRIHGVAGRRYLTLDDCFAGQTSYSMPGVGQQAYVVGRIITGHLFDQDEELNFDRCSVEFDQLANWVSRSGVKVQLQAPNENERVNHVEITFDKLTDEIVAFGDEHLALSSTWWLNGDNVTETSVFQATQLELRYPTARPLDDILKDVRWLQDLLTLTTAAATVPTEVLLWREDIVQDQPEFVPSKPKPQVMEYYAGQIAERVRLKGPQRPDRVMFGYQAIGGLATIARWIGIARQYEIVVQSLLSIRYAALYSQNRFYNVISAAESFHRLKFDNNVLPQAEFKAFRRSIIKAVPKEQRDWLGNQLQYSNEPRLRDRLVKMTDYTSNAFSALCSDVPSWIAVITESRNRLTHHDKERKIEFAAGDLHFLAESVFMLVMLCLFRECEVESATLEAIHESNSIQYLKSRLDDIVSRINGQISVIKERERLERNKDNTAPTGQPEPSTQQLHTSDDMPETAT